MSEGIALQIKNIDLTEHWITDARLYLLDPPARGAEYVVASATVAGGQPETVVFHSDEAGACTDWNELGGVRGALDHESALASIGYQIAETIEGKELGDTDARIAKLRLRLPESARLAEGGV